jgi:hypothetical protein
MEQGFDISQSFDAQSEPHGHFQAITLRACSMTEPLVSSAAGPDGRTARQALCICCFGRGGSSLLWHFLGSSPDVWMMEREWHEAVFDRMTLVRKGLRRATRHGLLRRLGSSDHFHDRMVQKFVRHRAEAALVPDGELRHPDARLVGIKVMDYNIVWHDSILRAFGGGRTVILMRRPVPQCESLLRSGLSLEQACNKYNEVAAYMADLCERPESVIVRFDDFLANPSQVMAQTCAALNIIEPTTYVAKIKPYGSKRQASTDVSARNLGAIPREELRDFVDSDVDALGAARLSARQRREIEERTLVSAERLGYAHTTA